MQWEWETDGWIVVAGGLCSIASSLLGSLLILRRMSLIGDAISHSVLPGIAAAFIFWGSRGSWAVLTGAAVMGLLTVWLTEFIRKYGRVEESAAIGVVFTTLFAVGLVMMVRAGDKIDLDPGCVLYGNLEPIIFDTIDTPIGRVPRVVPTLAAVCVLNGLAIVFFFKQWQISTFDPLLSHAQGIHPTLFHYILASLVAVTCIASFEAVGNILVIAMLVVPPATAFLLCNRLSTMICLSAVIGAVSAVIGHASAITVPTLFGLESVNSAAMIAVACGAFLAIAVVLSPKSGILFRWISQERVARKIIGDDILAYLYRRAESRNLKQESSDDLPIEELVPRLQIPVRKVRSVVRDLVQHGSVRWTGAAIQLTEDGKRVAQNLVRSHRLWEQYMSVEMNVSDTRLHAQAESLEHFTSSSMRGKLDVETGSSTTDPHGRSIPPEG